MQKHAFLVTYSYSSDPQAPLRALKPPRIGGRESLPPPLNIPQPNSANVIQVPIDHFGHKTSATFSNRYWLNATYYKSGGPVFLFDSGEQNAEPLVPYYIQEYHGLSAVMRLAKRYNGLALLWEHRFYGESLPFPVNGNTTSEQWQFLNTEQALEDIVFFANSFAQSELSADGPISSDPLQKFAVHPSKTPWIMLGGSYPGIRSALMRIRNPSVIFASWASSAPVQAQVDMSSYYKAAERSMTRNCSADWVAVTKYVDDTLSGSNETAVMNMKFELLKAHLSGPGGNTTGANGLTMAKANSTSNVNAASVLMDPLNFYQYYGFKDSILPFCNILESQNRTAEPVEGGVVAQFGIDIGFKSFLTAISEVDYAAIPGDPDDPVQDRSWMWQYCSEYGFYQRGDPNNPLSIETSFLSLELFQQQCDETFPKGLPSSPQVQNVNKYGGWKMNPSNVMFSNGEFDPWRTMGLASIESNAPNRKPSVSVPACNTPASSPSSFFGITYDNMVHVSDMRVLITPDANHSDFKTVGFYSPVSQEPFFTGLGLFQLAMDEWLPCFGR
ncbi:serine carboxypeptidase S28-domain-containing protein [Gymnopilus junonius]|uniref:Serine carboxypeptidase S28-domain-containing protein n=1 Tax=Gymnopilus junonius TaxID=109634 RepID=A0A9P5NI36_GYMJU|nr:serine carboxypeptidase S28-domain-containing protein [Gymnopilus junonius]